TQTNAGLQPKALPRNSTIYVTVRRTPNSQRRQMPSPSSVGLHYRCTTGALQVHSDNLLLAPDQILYEVAEQIGVQRFNSANMTYDRVCISSRRLFLYPRPAICDGECADQHTQ